MGTYLDTILCQGKIISVRCRLPPPQKKNFTICKTQQLIDALLVSGRATVIFSLYIKSYNALCIFLNALFCSLLL